MSKLKCDHSPILLLACYVLLASQSESVNPFVPAAALADSGHTEISKATSDHLTEIARPLPVRESTVTIDNDVYAIQSAGQSWSQSSPDPETLRFELHHGDHWSSPSWTDPISSERDEIAGQTVYPAGTQINIAYELMVEPGPTNSASGPGRWLVLSQMHEYNIPNSPPLAIELVDGDHMAVNIGTRNPIYLYVDPNPIQRGRYYSMTIEVKFANDGNGFLKVWRDSSKIVDYRGSIGTGAGTYWKQGIYRSSANETFAVSFRRLKISTVVMVTGIRTSLVNGTDGHGKIIRLTLDMSDAVTVSGTPILALSNGETASYTNGSGSNALVFSFEAERNDASASIPDVIGVDLPNGATVKNALGATADLSLASSVRSDLQPDKH